MPYGTPDADLQKALYRLSVVDTDETTGMTFSATPGSMMEPTAAEAFVALVVDALNASPDLIVSAVDRTYTAREAYTPEEP